MRRSTLLTLMALGAVITLIGGSGLFAALVDTATTGTNSVSSRSLAPVADLQIASGSRPGDAGPIICGDFTENLTTGLYTISDLQPTTEHLRFVCLRNAGSAQVTVSVAVVELANVDVECTGDEAEYDPTCGGNGAGELGALAKVSFTLRPLVALLPAGGRNRRLPAGAERRGDVAVPVLRSVMSTRPTPSPPSSSTPTPWRP